MAKEKEKLKGESGPCLHDMVSTRTTCLPRLFCVRYERVHDSRINQRSCFGLRTSRERTIETEVTATQARITPSPSPSPSSTPTPSPTPTPIPIPSLPPSPPPGTISALYPRRYRSSNSLH
uniref:Uncharacterized protein n=1 Tax=Vespula pensylvanica TaxID=30213 RepID=A0A834NPX9_VESPE|nr:hypothetical protein H0235_011978 [Vespula pensylvanica]